MATVSSANGGTSFSNGSMGTRGMSASDWTRLQRIRGAKGYGLMTGNATTPNGTATSAIYPRNKDISPSELRKVPYNQALLIPYDSAGTLKTLRSAGNWTDYIAAQTGDFVTAGQALGANGLVTPTIRQSITKICNANIDSTTLPNKPPLPMSNQVNRMKIIS